MTEFSLSKSKRKALPNAVMVEGSALLVNPDFRVILKILRMVDDDAIPDMHKPILLCQWFYQESIPASLVSQAVEAFQCFLRLGDTSVPQTKSDPVFDHEQDAAEIYASFLSLYGIDLMEVNMHWWKFSALLDGAFRSQCALAEKIRMRTLDPDEYKDPAAIRRMQDEIRIETRFSRAEKQMQKRLKDILTGGGDVSAALEALKNEL